MVIEFERKSNEATAVTPVSELSVEQRLALFFASALKWANMGWDFSKADMLKEALRLEIAVEGRDRRGLTKYQPSLRVAESFLRRAAPVPQPSLTNAEVATILHGLRLIQCEGRIEGCAAGNCEHFEEVEPLSNEQIDALCEKLNLNKTRSNFRPLGASSVEALAYAISVAQEEVAHYIQDDEVDLDLDHGEGKWPQVAAELAQKWDELGKVATLIGQPRLTAMCEELAVNLRRVGDGDTDGETGIDNDCRTNNPSRDSLSSTTGCERTSTGGYSCGAYRAKHRSSN